MQTDFFQETTKVLTVAELTRAIRSTLETKFGAVWVQGEISNYKLHPSGHQYFTLKDQRAQIACVIFRNTLPPFPKPLSDGAQVQVYGQISVFEARGQYQLSVQILQTRGLGLLQAKFEALKRKLEAEGLFEPARKRPLPKFPKRIGIVTSRSGAAIRDVLNVLARRAPGLQVLVSPIRVQGSGAAAEIAFALRELTRPNESWPPLDLVLLTRGGGSIEDLWEFNEEIVARAISDAQIPVVSAIGHEIDFTIADFVADLRAPTPSAAAELIVADSSDVQRRLRELSGCLERLVRNFVSQNRRRLGYMSERNLARELLQRIHHGEQRLDRALEVLSRLPVRTLGEARARVSSAQQCLKIHSPARELARRRERIEANQRRLISLPAAQLAKAQQRFRHTEGILRVLGPHATLRRGYSITTSDTGAVIKSASEVRPGELIHTRVADGSIASRVAQ